MRPVWLIEAGIYGAEAVPLVEEIRRQGMAADLVRYEALKVGAPPIVIGARALDEDACVVGYGTYPFAQQILIHHRWVPGAWCSAANLDCDAYYPHFREHLLNRRSTILSNVEAIRRKDALFAEYGVDDQLFIRPTSCHKLFVGRTVDSESFADALAPTRYDPTSRIVVAEPQTIDREWRVIVVDDRVVSGGQYAVEGMKDVTPDFPAEVRSYAERVLTEVPWRPDPAFMLDVAARQGELSLVELNSFSGSWLYQCDLAKVVESIGDLAARTWRSHTGS
jgi:hypothetical protein